MLVGDECVKEMFDDKNLRFWFSRINVPEDFQEAFTSLFLSIAGSALNCGTRHAPTEIIINSLQMKPR